MGETHEEEEREGFGEEVHGGSFFDGMNKIKRIGEGGGKHDQISKFSKLLNWGGEGWTELTDFF
jgi:hypothetical protein